MALTATQIDELNPGDVLADPAGEDVWFVHQDVSGRGGLRIIRQDGRVLAGREMMRLLRHLNMARQNPVSPTTHLTMLERIAKAKTDERKARRAAQIQKEFEESLRNDPGPTWPGPAPLPSWE